MQVTGYLPASGWLRITRLEGPSTAVTILGAIASWDRVKRGVIVGAGWSRIAHRRAARVPNRETDQTVAEAGGFRSADAPIESAPVVGRCRSRPASLAAPAIHDDGRAGNLLQEVDEMRVAAFVFAPHDEEPSR
jgi:hypothetical protein